MTKIYLACTFLIFSLNPLIGQKTENNATPSFTLTPELIENKVSFNKSITTNKLEYKLEPHDDGSLKLIFINRPTNYISIKIYDLIGNIIIKEENKYTLNSELEYNLNKQNGKVFVVKIESGEENLIKTFNF